jgi:signal transduction histidine kinase
VIAAILVQAGLILALLAGRVRLRESTAALQQSEERLSMAANATEIGLWIGDFATREIWVSDGCRRMLGLPDTPVQTVRSMARAIHPNDRSRMLREVGRAVAGDGHFEAECRLSRGGGERLVTSRGQVEFGTDGRALRMRGVTTDTTARHAAEKTARDLSGRLINAREDERARLARELHDDVTQRLAVLAIDAGQGESRAADAAGAALLRRLREGLARLSDDVHALSYRLHPSILADLGLLDAVQAECDRFARAEGIPVSVLARDLPERVSADVALCLYRILQEALRNVARHSDATGVEVELLVKSGRLIMTVTDNGTGFVADEKSSTPSLGLASMRQRVDHVGGTFGIESTAGRGTKIRVSAPLKEDGLEATARIAG